MDLKRMASRGGGYPLAVGLVVLASLVLLPLRSLLPPTTIMLFYVPVIVGVARLTGVRPSMAAAVVSFVALDLLFVPPYYHPRVAELAEWLGLIAFLVVAVVAGQQTGALRQRERAALSRQRELEFLNRLSFRVASEKSLQPTAEFIVHQVTDVLGADRVAVYMGGDGLAAVECLVEAGDPKPSSGEAALVAWVVRTGHGVGLPTAPESGAEEGAVNVGAIDAVPGISADGSYLPLCGAQSLQGALYVRLGEPDRPTADDARLLVAVANLAAAAIERQRLEEKAAHTEALREADRLKATFFSSISHELKTPLAAATARITGLVEEGETSDPTRMHEELVEVAHDLERLNGSIGDLLDLSRLESDAWQPQFEPCDLRDILGTTLSRLPAAWATRVRFELPDDLPEVNADFSQLTRAIGHLVENALAYSPPEESVIVGASRRADLRIWVEDRGPGVADGEKPRVFDKFYRGAAAQTAPTGTGLGLAIAREIVRSHGGTLRVEDAAPNGARFVMTLPAPVGKGPHER